MFATRVDAQSPAGDEMRREVSPWAQKVRRHAMDHHPKETLTNIFPMTDNYFDTVSMEQAFPGLIRGRSLLACFGKDVTIEDYTKEVTFSQGIPDQRI
jgi:hypothetical protein